MPRRRRNLSVNKIELGLCDSCGRMGRMTVIECNGDPLSFCLFCMKWLKSRLMQEGFDDETD